MKRIKIRQLDDWHIPVWILKDTAWMLQIKPLGVAMIVPAVAISVWLCVKTYYIKSRFFSYVAVLCWISANSTWMLHEFYDWSILWAAFSLFGLGLFSFLASLVAARA